MSTPAELTYILRVLAAAIDAAPRPTRRHLAIRAHIKAIEDEQYLSQGAKSGPIFPPGSPLFEEPK